MTQLKHVDVCDERILDEKKIPTCDSRIWKKSAYNCNHNYLYLLLTHRPQMHVDR